MGVLKWCLLGKNSTYEELEILIGIDQNLERAFAFKSVVCSFKELNASTIEVLQLCPRHQKLST